MQHKEICFLLRIRRTCREGPWARGQEEGISWPHPPQREARSHAPQSHHEPSFLFQISCFEKHPVVTSAHTQRRQHPGTDVNGGVLAGGLSVPGWRFNFQGSSV